VKRYDDALEAVRRAAFMASASGGPYAVVPARPQGFTVAALSVARKHELKVLEVCQP